VEVPSSDSINLNILLSGYRPYGRAGTPVILKSHFLLVLCAELVAEIPSSRSAPCHYVAILQRERLLTVRASGWLAADKISGVDHHIVPPGEKPTTVLVQSDTGAMRGCQ
jgi:hypothetical protein